MASMGALAPISTCTMRAITTSMGSLTSLPLYTNVMPLAGGFTSGGAVGTGSSGSVSPAGIDSVGFGLGFCFASVGACVGASVGASVVASGSVAASVAGASVGASVSLSSSSALSTPKALCHTAGITAVGLMRTLP